MLHAHSPSTVLSLQPPGKNHVFLAWSLKELLLIAVHYKIYSALAFCVLCLPSESNTVSSSYNIT